MTPRLFRLGLLGAILLAYNGDALPNGDILFFSIDAAGVADDSNEKRRMSPWVEVDYGALVDGRRLTHSGGAVATLLKQLDGRPYPRPGERPEDAAAHRVLEPLLEPYAFVLPDVIDSLGTLTERPMWDVGSLWQPGEPQPAWVELLRSRRYVVESDGSGRLRVFAPLPPTPETAEQPASDAAARVAWEAAWPVLRHVVAAEIHRLAERAATSTRSAIDVEVHAYSHDLARTRFLLGTAPYRINVTDTRPRASRSTLDLAAWRKFLDSGLQLEGARLEPDGRIRLLSSEVDDPPTLLGRPLSLADLAVAYRAVFHGGLAEPYMSLDRSLWPYDSLVSYGGRLQDTSLGLVSLMCDIRFKTFSLGRDILRGEDVREEVRADVGPFMTHLERLAADPRSAQVSGQQTRLWFYPDDVDLTLSSQGDVLVIRRARMTAASERVESTTWTASATQDPPWTQATIASINVGYGQLAGLFPELGDLDQVVRLLALFSWLRLAGAEGFPLPDLDALLAVELPAVPTPRRFPQMLAFNALPAVPGAGAVDVVGRADVGEALERLESSGGRPLPALSRVRRSMAWLDRRRPDHAALLDEVAGYRLEELDAEALDLLAYRAERLRMHRLVLTTLPEDRREAFASRERAGERLRVFSVGIGGLDLSMDGALRRATRRRSTGLWGDRSAPPAPPRGSPTLTMRSRKPSPPAPAPPETETVAAAGALPATVLPDHGGGWEYAEGGSPDTPGITRWQITGPDGPSPRARRLIVDVEKGRVLAVERLDDAQQLHYRFEGRGPVVRAVPVDPVRSDPVAEADEERAPLPAGLLLIDVPRAFASDAASPGVGIRLRFADRQLTAELPRAALQRLVLGRDVDADRGRSIPGLSPLPDEVGVVRRVMLSLGPEGWLPPWEGRSEPVPGEEDPVRLASALRTWWVGAPGAPRYVAVASDPAISATRWEKAPPPGRKAVLVLPDDGFPALASPYRDRLRDSWEAGEVTSGLPAGKLPTLVVLVSGEAPAALGSRVRRMAANPSMKDRYLAVVALSGPLRTDLIASVVRETGLAGIGVADARAAGLAHVVDRIGGLGRSVAASEKDTRVEDLSDVFLWFY